MPRWKILTLTASLAAVCAPAVQGAVEAPPLEAPSPDAPAASAPEAAAPAASRPARLRYPESATVDHADVYHGVKVADPYRWLEDLDSPQTRSWVEAQNEVTFGYLETIPARERIRRRLTELWNYERYGIPVKEGGRYFIGRNDGLQNQSVIYTMERLDGEPRELLDPNRFSADGTVALSSMEVSEDGRLLAYGLSSGGSDWEEIKVRDVATGRDLPDHLRWVKFSNIAWTADSQGFFYSRYDEPKAGEQLEQANYFQKLYYHRLGTPQSADRLVYDRPDRKEWGFQGIVTDDGRYLVVHVWQGTEIENGVFYQDLQTGAVPAADGSPGAPGPVTELLDRFDASYSFVGNDGPVFFFTTNLDAPRRRLIAVDVRDPARERWREVIREGRDAIQSVRLAGDRFLVEYLKDAHSRVQVFDLAGRPLREVALPGLGNVSGFYGDRDEAETFYSFTSYTTPPTIYRYDLATDESSLFRRPEVAFDPALYDTRQVFYTSKDGTRVPMFITAKKGLKLDGGNPTLLYGYGGFNIPMTPGFSVPSLVWMEMGGVYAVANLRGGGEYGEEWHQAGAKLKKQNVFDDFIAAGEWLIANGYTSREKLAITGRSNGGLLVGAAITQRPDLFGAAVVGVGVLDMLRFHKFTIGWGWVSDYGSPEDPDEWKALYAYSPYHNLKPGTAYPATLITTADHDDRVVPAHSFKFAAALQKAQGGPEPVLIRIETRAGHGSGKPVSKQIEEAADEMAFLARSLGMPGGGGEPAAAPRTGGQTGTKSGQTH
jgi:prolyl oligopeptidase